MPREIQTKYMIISPIPLELFQKHFGIVRHTIIANSVVTFLFSRGGFSRNSLLPPILWTTLTNQVRAYHTRPMWSKETKFDLQHLHRNTFSLRSLRMDNERVNVTLWSLCVDFILCGGSCVFTVIKVFESVLMCVILVLYSFFRTRGSVISLASASSKGVITKLTRWPVGLVRCSHHHLIRISLGCCR